ncbi:hypothetical protein ACLI4Y_12535 [Natrialbaceae archaeon A-CW3]
MGTGLGDEAGTGVSWRARPITIWLYALLAVALGVTALFGGVIMLLDPSGTTMALQVEWLDGTPFRDYFIPGLILFGVLGVGSLVVVYGIARRRQWAWWAAVGLGIALVGWITTQVLLLQMYHILQFVYGALGATLVALAVHPSTRTDLRR